MVIITHQNQGGISIKTNNKSKISGSSCRNIRNNISGFSRYIYAKSIATGPVGRLQVLHGFDESSLSL